MANTFQANPAYGSIQKLIQEKGEKDIQHQYFFLLLFLLFNVQGMCFLRKKSSEVIFTKPMYAQRQETLPTHEKENEKNQTLYFSISFS